MILPALVLLCCNTLSGDTPPLPTTPSVVAGTTATAGKPTLEADSVKPDAPAPKTALSSSSNTVSEVGSTGETSTPAILPIVNSPVTPAAADSYETPRERKIWYGLMAVSHGAAAFDAWTTRRAVSGGYGVEGDPLQRPFAHSGAIYATTQLTPILMDYLGHRMMRSSHPTIRKAWWVPQAASASVSLGAGFHNYSVVP